MKASQVFIYDTTLRDGTQGEHINFSAEEKVRIARRLDEMGFHYIEGGWPGSNPKDARFFEMAKGTSFRHARLTAFGSTCKPGLRPENCRNLKALLKAETPAVAIFGKSWDLHVTEILGITPKENLKIIRDTVTFLKGRGKEVIFDAEHFFDGYRRNSSYALATLKAALAAGADRIVLCDTNGGTLPHDLTAAVMKVAAVVPPERLGIHAHNDGGLAVANTIAAVQAGVAMVQGTVNGYGERCGNADLTTVIANLQLKMNRACLPEESLRQLTNLSYYISEVANVRPIPFRPFVGRSAFAHKGGVHVHAVAKNPQAYEHIPPEWVGNQQRVVVSDLAGKSNIAFKAKEFGIDVGTNDALSKKIVREALLMKKITGVFEEPFTLECFSVMNGKTGNRPSVCQATIKISVGDEVELTAAEGNGPVNALDHALRKALTKFYPQISEMHLVDFKVRIVEGSEGTAARVKVLLESQDGDELWSTIGVSENIIEASWQALVDSIQYKLSKENLNKNDRQQRAG
ncbi:MAG: 2-isopropylmalate synthase [Candidatus Krumholzibacteriota bacterium]|nr:2-isopropylmalate synthase [Candidatus Krumholzibacteriota bacterium]